LNTGDVISSSQTIYVYTQTATTPNCSDENSFSVTINPTPVADAPANVTACDSYTLLALTVGNYYTGSGGTGTPLNTGDVISSSQTIYVYTQTETIPNCTDENSFSVTINNCDIEIQIPTAFTPDGDNSNDTWELDQLDATYPNNIVRIYNRWGNLIYESAKGNYNLIPWNGTYNDDPLPVASYYFIIEYNTDKLADTGTVSIVRK
jgi:gliding motility-associated-like protein